MRVKPGEIAILDVVHYSLFLNQTVDDYQNIIPVSDNECIFTLENGLALYRYDESLNEKQTTRLAIRSVLSFDAESKENVFLPVSDSVLTRIAIPYK